MCNRACCVVFLTNLVTFFHFELKEKAPEEHAPTLKEIRDKLDFSVHLQDRTVVQGGSVKFICAAVTTQKLEIRWYKGSAEVSYNPRVVNMNDPKDGFACLQIKRASDEDIGLYTCIFKTEKEKITTCGRLSVIPKDQVYQHDSDEESQEEIAPIFRRAIKGKHTYTSYIRYFEKIKQ